MGCFSGEILCKGDIYGTRCGMCLRGGSVSWGCAWGSVRVRIYVWREMGGCGDRTLSGMLLWGCGFWGRGTAVRLFLGGGVVFGIRLGGCAYKRVLCLGGGS